MAVISNKVIELMNFRIQQEELSVRIYLAMSLWLDYHGYIGAAKLWKKYSEEEKVHVGWAYSYMMDLNILPTVPTLEMQPKEFKGLPQIIALSYKHEVEVTSQCIELARQAEEDGDFMTLELAQRYLKEQTEELQKTQLWLDKLNSFGDDKVALRLMDDDMGDYAGL